MRSIQTFLPLVAALILLPGPVAAQTPDFEWSGHLTAGEAVEIRGVNGSIRALPSEDGSVRVEAARRARRSDPESVRIAVVEHAGGVTVCAVYPTPAGARRLNACRPGSGSSDTRNNDVQVDFVVRVPASVTLDANTVNGAVEAERLGSEVRASTVNGRVRIATTGFVSRVSTVNGAIELRLPAGLDADLRASRVNGRIDSDFPVTTQGSMSRRSLRGTIGEGGREMRLSTVNGSIRLRRSRAARRAP